jgi:regulator of nucleoside diphosphate kinase
MTARPEIYVTDDDLQRLERLLAASKRTANLDALADELGRAITVASDAVRPDIVTMNSKVRFRDLATFEESEIALVYPQDADVESGKVSVLAPVGSALLGLSAGQIIEWPMPAGAARQLRLEAVLYQPEAAGRRRNGASRSTRGRRLPPVLACDAGCGGRSRTHDLRDQACSTADCAGTLRPLPSLGWRAHSCSHCRGTGTAEDGGERYRCAACRGDGWRIVKRQPRG